LALVAAPLLAGIVNQTKAFFAGRRGPGFLRLYFDLAKLMRKSCPRSATSTWIFDLAPSIALAATVLAAFLFPWTLDAGWLLGPVASAVLFFYLLGTARFFTVLGALDTGSAFEGMGASREVQFSALVEPTVFVILGFLVLLTDGGADGVRALPGLGTVLTDGGADGVRALPGLGTGTCDALAGMLAGYPAGAWAHHSVSLVLALIAFFAILLSENCRVPFDDPETHLELTMIHEAMVLDNAGPDLAFILYGAALKLALFSAFLVAMVLPALPCGAFWRGAAVIGGTFVTAVAVGVTESVIARMRFLKTPQTLLAAFMLAALGVLLFVLF